jgi:hypothetical protein
LSVEGTETKVTVMHFGLGIAYFSDETGTLANYILPNNSGWKRYDYSEAGSTSGIESEVDDTITAQLLVV